MKKIIKTDNAPKPIGPYNQAVIAGDYMFISGQIALNPKNGKLITDDINKRNYSGYGKFEGYSFRVVFDI